MFFVKRSALLTKAVNRLDRLTSGLMILALSGPASRDLSMEFQDGQIRKEYVARVRGRFPKYVSVIYPLALLNV